MKNITQSKNASNETLKNLASMSKDTEAFKALFEAVGECCAKPAFDYQRIIVCLTPGPIPGAVLRCGAVLANPDGQLESEGSSSVVVVVEEEKDWTWKMLETIVRFINCTRGVVVLMAAAESIFRWHDLWRVQFDQIRRRIHVTIEFNS
jgi:hypothetical protein